MQDQIPPSQLFFDLKLFASVISGRFLHSSARFIYACLNMYLYIKLAYKKHTHTFKRLKKQMKMISQMYQSTNKELYLQSQERILLVVTTKRNKSIIIHFSFLNAEQLINSLAIQFDIDLEKLNHILLFTSIQNSDTHSYVCFN